MQGLVYGHFMAKLDQVCCNRQTGRTRPDDTNALSRGRRLIGKDLAVLPFPVGHKPLQVPYAQGCPLLPDQTRPLTLICLWADPSCYPREQVLFLHQFYCPYEIPFGNPFHKTGAVNAYGATGFAGPVFTTETTTCFIPGLYRRVSQRHLLEASFALFRMPFRHGNTLEDQFLFLRSIFQLL